MRLASLALVLVCLADVDTAFAAFTTDKCLVLKRQAWGTLRKCESALDVKRLKGKAIDPSVCQTQFEKKLAKIDAKATKAAIACHYRANGDGTVTDYDTGLMWEVKDGTIGEPCLFVPETINHCVNATFTLPAAFAYVSGRTIGTVLPISFLAGYIDWRLPTAVELHTIFEFAVPGCSNGLVACVDPSFGPTLLASYWTASSEDGMNGGIAVNFHGGSGPIQLIYSARAVRRAF